MPPTARSSLFDSGAPQPRVEIPFPDEFRIGNVWSMIVFDLDYENTEYGFRMDGPFDPDEGHRFDKTKILMDPYAKAICRARSVGQNAELGRQLPAPLAPGVRRFRLAE